MHEEASRILSMDNEFEVMKYSHEVLPPEKVQEGWRDMAIAQMEEVNHVKYHTCEYVKMLLEEAPGCLIEATSDTFWGSGLGPDMTKTTLHDYWPGQNNMGWVLTKIQEELAIEADNPTMDPRMVQEISAHLQDDLDTESEPETGNKRKAVSPLQGDSK